MYLRCLIGFAFSIPVFGGLLPNIPLDGRIVNGVYTTIQQHPHQVSLQTNDGSHFCGGSIIAEDIILTAAHCMMVFERLKDYQIQAHEFKVRLGASKYNMGGELVAVKSLKIHDNFDPNSKMNDVALVKLATPVRESKNVRYIPLVEKTPATGTTAVVTGWGTTCFITCDLSENLQEVEVDILDYKTCASSDYGYGSDVKETMVCAYAVDQGTCQGDSGGPLVVDDKLVGVVSWGAGCAAPGYPGVYADIASVRGWIEKTSKEM
ncbi:trypsin-like [Haematobia irritans]|uniref:Putative trypsin-like protein n=1 Tax=Haematobia irritans TaxID=7368 RepID=A0A1L8EAP1_HAEIR